MSKPLLGLASVGLWIKGIAAVMILTAGVGALTSCASTQKTNSPIESLAPAEYAALIKKHTRGTDQYQGFHQTFQADVTILNSEVQAATTRQRAQFLGWDEPKFQEEREKAIQDSNAYAKFFLRFFSPNNEYDDLSKGKTIWKVYLELQGRRFEGKVQKVSSKLVETITLYPHMNRFSTPYIITFNVPMTTLERDSAKVTLTSSLGSSEFSF